MIDNLEVLQTFFLSFFSYKAAKRKEREKIEPIQQNDNDPIPRIKKHILMDHAHFKHKQDLQDRIEQKRSQITQHFQVC